MLCRNGNIQVSCEEEEASKKAVYWLVFGTVGIDG